jgi:CHRD domain
MSPVPDTEEDRMRRLLVLAIAAASLIAMITAPIVAGDSARRFKASLDGFQETPMAISTTGRGSFTARVSGDTLRFRLTYRNLSGPPTMAHIHFGAAGTSGGISIWLCGSATNNHPSQPATCPTTASGHVSATVSAANVVGPTGQGIAPGEWDEVLRAIRAGVTYANIHTTLYPPGEIRGRITRD